MPFASCLVVLGLLQSATWKPYTLNPGIIVQLPAIPKETKSQKLAPGSRIWTSIHSERTAIVLGFFPDDKKEKLSPDQILARVVAGQVSGSHATLTGQRDILVKGWPGVEIRTGVQGGLFALTRMIATTAGVIEMSVVGDTTGALTAPSDRLFASLILPASIGAGPLTEPGPKFRRLPFGDRATIEFPAEPKADKVTLPQNPISKTMQRYISTYGNRVYVAGYLDVPAQIMSETDPTKLDVLLEQLNDASVGSLGVYNQQSKQIKIAGDRALLTEGTLDSDRQYVKVESVIHDGRLYSFLVSAPDVMRGAAEVERFMNSIEFLPAKK